METLREQEGVFQTYKLLVGMHHSFTCLIYSHRKTLSWKLLVLTIFVISFFKNLYMNFPYKKSSTTARCNSN